MRTVYYSGRLRVRGWGERVCLARGVCVWPRGGCLPKGVCGAGGYARGGVSAWGVSAQGGVCLPGGGVYTSPPVDIQTPVKTSTQ